MLVDPPQTSRSTLRSATFRAALLFAAAWLALYIPFKYATQLHAISGLYAVAFPLSAILALAGIVVAWKPRTACDCGVPVRAGVGAVSVLWVVTGMLCVGSLADGIGVNPLRGAFATFQMVVQHVFLSLTLLAFAFVPARMARALGAASRPAQTIAGARSVSGAPI